MASFRVVLFLLTLTRLSLIPSYGSRVFPGPELESTGLDCWTALYKIRSCSNEIVAYFTNGAIDITPPCCDSISIITHHCWPTVLGVLGYDTDQTDILRGYCDAVTSLSTIGFVGPSPTPAPIGLPLPPVN